jgi:hypothetical protein
MCEQSSMVDRLGIVGVVLCLAAPACGSEAIYMREKQRALEEKEAAVREAQAREAAALREAQAAHKALVDHQEALAAQQEELSKKLLEAQREAERAKLEAEHETDDGDASKADPLAEL